VVVFFFLFFFGRVRGDYDDADAVAPTYSFLRRQKYRSAFAPTDYIKKYQIINTIFIIIIMHLLIF